MDKFKAVQRMINMLHTENPPLFVVMFQPGSGYEIGGQQQEKLHLTVSMYHTSFIHQTQEGFECVARFPANDAANLGIWDPALSDALVEERVNVRLQNIARIDGVTEGGRGKLMTLYQEPLGMDEKMRYTAVFNRTASLSWL
jgi:hypothetical protein